MKAQTVKSIEIKQNGSTLTLAMMTANQLVKFTKVVNYNTELPFDDEKVDNNLSIDEIRKKIFSKGHEQVKLRKAYLWKNVDVNKIIKYFGNYKCPRSHEWTCKMIAIQIKALNEFKKMLNKDRI